MESDEPLLEAPDQEPLLEATNPANAQGEQDTTDEHELSSASTEVLKRLFDRYTEQIKKIDDLTEPTESDLVDRAFNVGQRNVVTAELNRRDQIRSDLA